jgi:hypothetical protein
MSKNTENKSLTIQNFRRVIQANRATSNTIQLDR